MSARGPQEGCFALQAGVDAEALVDGLAALMTLRRGTGDDGAGVLLDTPDGRLAAAKALLVGSGDGRTTLRLLRPGHVELSAELAVRPAFASELPDGRLREALVELAGPRRLLAVLELSGRSRALDVLDDEGKTVVRLRLSAPRLRRVGETGEPQALPRMLGVAPVRGHAQAHAALLSVLRSRPGLQAVEGDALAALREAVVRALPPPPPEPGADVSRRLRADEALRRIGRAQLAVLRSNEAGLRADLDSEFLHDWRVAVRRTRSLFGQIRDVFPVGELARHREELGWLARLTGSARDLDVFLLELEQATRGAEALPGLQPVIEELRARRAEAQRELVEGLDSPRAAAALRAWEAFLHRSPEAKPSETDADRPLGELAARRALKLHRRITRTAAALPAQAPAVELHALRIECKKLRYVLDGARSQLDAGALAAVLAVLKRLQSALGEAHDAHVQRELLEASAGRLSARGLAPAGTLLDVGRLAERLARSEDAARAQCAERFAELAAPAVAASLRALWKVRAR